MNEEKNKKPSDLEYLEQIKYLKEVIEKIKKEIMADVFNAQKDLDTLKSSKLNTVDFYEFRNITQAALNKFDTLNYLPESVRGLGIYF